MINHSLKNTDKIYNAYNVLLIILLIIQPILELVWFNNGTIGEIAGFTIPTIIRFGLVGIIGCMSIVVVKFNKKHLLLAGYGVLVILYIILHHIFSADFRSFVPGDFDYNLLKEIFYILRMLVPIVVIYFVYNSKITEDIMKKIVLWISGFVTIIVVVTNILKVSLGSYSDKKILGNIFDWFLHQGKYTFNDLASKGFFYWSIFSTVLILIYPFLIYLYLKEKKQRYLILIILQGLALYMFGTKVTTFSVVIELVLMLLVYLFCILLKRESGFAKKQVVSLFIVIVIGVVILPYTPSVSRISFDEEYKKSIDEEEGEWSFSGDFEKYLDENYMYLSVKEEFMLDSYNYKYDLEFWNDLLNELGPSERMQNRIIEQRMLERVKEINNDKMDAYFGLGYTRTSNIYNLERDFLYQYYSMGIFGVILFLGPYIAILLLVMGLMLLKFKNNFNVENCALVLGLGLSMCGAYYSGNVMESLGITIIMGAMCGYLLKVILENK